MLSKYIRLFFVVLFILGMSFANDFEGYESNIYYSIINTPNILSTFWDKSSGKNNPNNQIIEISCSDDKTNIDPDLRDQLEYWGILYEYEGQPQEGVTTFNYFKISDGLTVPMPVSDNRIYKISVVWGYHEPPDVYMYYGQASDPVEVRVGDRTPPWVTAYKIGGVDTTDTQNIAPNAHLTITARDRDIDGRGVDWEKTVVYIDDKPATFISASATSNAGSAGEHIVESSASFAPADFQDYATTYPVQVIRLMDHAGNYIPE